MDGTTTTKCPILVHLTTTDKVLIHFDKSKIVADLLSYICFLSGIEDSSYFGLFINEEIKTNDFWLNNAKPLEDQIENVTFPLALYLRIRFYVPNPQDISEYSAKVFFAYSLMALVKVHISQLSSEEMELIQANFNHGLELQKSNSTAYKEISDLPPIVTLNSFLYRVSQLKFYLDGTFSFDFKDKITGTVASASLSHLGIKFRRGTCVLFVIPWIKFEKISFKTNFVKMQVKGEKARAIPPQSFSLEFPSIFMAKSFWRLCIENHKFYCYPNTPKKVLVPDFVKYGYLAKNIKVETFSLSYIHDSYNLVLSGGIEDNFPPYVSEVSPDLSPKLPPTTVILFINDKCTFNLSLAEVNNLMKCHAISRSSIKLGVLKDFIHIYHQKVTITCRSISVIENFVSLMTLTAENQDLIDKILIILPKVIGNNFEEMQLSIDQLREDVKTGEFRRQYNSIPKFWPASTYEIASSPNIRYLNRYRDTLPYDHNIVPISGGNGYINASFVEFSKSDVVLKFIACQGPTDYSAGDFYTMIWESKTDVIIMVTGLVEKGIEKCHKYWPKLSETVVYGHFTVKTITERDCGVYIWSELELSAGEETLVVNHFRYTGWPDHGVPEDLCEFYNFVIFLADFVESESSSIPVVHCSAGVGRTGVVIVSMIILHLIRSRLPVVPFSIVESLRQSRALIVQTLEQYYFICRLALHMIDSYLDVNVG